jgi:hypothetical protein
MEEYKRLLDSGSVDVGEVPELLRQLALSAVVQQAALLVGDSKAVFVPLATSKAGKPLLMQALLQWAVNQLAVPMQQKLVVLTALQRTRNVQQRSAVGQRERAALAEEHLQTLVLDDTVPLPAGSCNYILVDDLLHTGGSLTSGRRSCAV